MYAIRSDQIGDMPRPMKSMPLSLGVGSTQSLRELLMKVDDGFFKIPKG